MIVLASQSPRRRELLERAGIPCGLVRSVKEALADVVATPETDVFPVTGGEIRLAPPDLDEHGDLIRKFYWSAFDHVPILARNGV